jgi:hypothetical protein
MMSSGMEPLSMTPRDTHDARVRTAEADGRFDPASLRLPAGASRIAERILDGLFFIGLIGAGILLSGLAARLLFGPSVIAAL